MLHFGLHWSEPLRVASAIELTDEQEGELTRLARSKRTSVRLAQRSRIVLLAAQGLQNKDIAQQLGIGRVQVARWRERYLESGVQGILRPAVTTGYAARTFAGLASTRAVTTLASLHISKQGMLSRFLLALLGVVLMVSVSWTTWAQPDVQPRVDPVPAAGAGQPFLSGDVALVLAGAAALLWLMRRRGGDQ